MNEKNLKKFSKEYQPTPEAKSRGWAEKAARRKASKKIYEAQSALLFGGETNAKSVEGVSKLFGKDPHAIKHIHTLLARLYMSALEGNTQAANKLLDFSYLDEDAERGTAEIIIKVIDE